MIKRWKWVVMMLLTSLFSGAVSLLNLQGWSIQSFTDYATVFILKTLNAKEIFAFSAFIAILPLFVFMIWNGTLIYEHWNLTGIYIIVRQRNRTHAFLRDTFHLALRSVFGSVIFLAMPIIHGLHMLYGVMLQDYVQIFQLFIAIGVLCYIISMLQNLVSVLRGSSYGYLFSTISFFVFGKIAMTFLESANVSRMLLSVWNPFTVFYMSVRGTMSIFQMLLYSLIQISIVTGIGLFLIRRIDLGLENKEMI